MRKGLYVMTKVMPFTYTHTDAYIHKWTLTIINSCSFILMFGEIKHKAGIKNDIMHLDNLKKLTQNLRTSRHFEFKGSHEDASRVGKFKLELYLLMLGEGVFMLSSDCSCSNFQINVAHKVYIFPMNVRYQNYR